MKGSSISSSPDWSPSTRRCAPCQTTILLFEPIGAFGAGEQEADRDRLGVARLGCEVGEKACRRDKNAHRADAEPFFHRVSSSLRRDNPSAQASKPTGINRVEGLKQAVNLAVETNPAPFALASFPFASPESLGQSARPRPGRGGRRSPGRPEWRRKGTKRSYIHYAIVFSRKQDYRCGWRVPSSVPRSVHGLKYSLFYGRPGVREIGYDNECGKGALDRRANDRLAQPLP